MYGADKKTIHQIKKATSGEKGLPFSFTPYEVSNKDIIRIKNRKNGSPKNIRIRINGKYLALNKMEWLYDSDLKKIRFSITFPNRRTI